MGCVTLAPEKDRLTAGDLDCGRTVSGICETHIFISVVPSRGTTSVATALGRLLWLWLWCWRIAAAGRTTCGLLRSVRVSAALGLRVAATGVSGVSSGCSARVGAAVIRLRLGGIVGRLFRLFGLGLRVRV